VSEAGGPMPSRRDINCAFWISKACLEGSGPGGLLGHSGLWRRQRSALPTHRLAGWPVPATFACPVRTLRTLHANVWADHGPGRL